MESDISQSDILWRLWAWFEKNKKPVIYASSAVGAVALVTWFFVWRAHEKQVEASSELTKVSIAQMMTPGGATQDVSSAYLKITANHPGTSAAERALLLAGASLFTQGKYAEAQTQFGRFIRENANSPFLAQAKLGLAASLEAQGKTNEALNEYKGISERHPNEVAAPQAKFALGRIYEAQNQPQLARKYFEDVARTDPGTSIGSEAGMRLEELNAKYPPPAPTNSAVSIQPSAAKGAPVSATNRPMTSPAKK